MSFLRRHAGTAAAAAVLAVPAPAAAQAPDQVGQWGPVMDFHAPATHQVLLHDGEVLYWRTGAEATLFDPATNQLTAVAAPFPIPGFNIHCDAMAVLPDGRVLAIGGQVDGPHQAVNMAAIFDPATRAWTQIPSMHYPRWYPTATVLSDGRVAVFGGESATVDPSNPNAMLPTTPVEIYDPLANKWTVLPNADRAQDLYAPDYLLPDGRIFDALPNSASNVNRATPGLATGLLDLGSGTWTAGPVAHYRTIGYSESFAMYRPGKIIRAGGTLTTQAAVTTATNRAETVDMTAPAPAWQATASMAFPRRRENMVILADGQVMAVGGTRQNDDPQQAVLAGEIWNPQTGQWTTVASMRDPRMYHSAALLLPDGRVLSAGGEPSTANVGFQNNQPAPPAQTAQIYSPPYLFKGPRPQITGAPSRIGYSTAFSITTPDAGAISSVALIRPSAVTHANNMGEGYVPLQFTRGDGSLSAISPANGNWAPPGWYMLVVENGAGVPSVARWVQVGEGPVLDDPGFTPGQNQGGGGNGGGGNGGGGNGGGGNGGGQPARPTTLRLARRMHASAVRTHGLRFALDIGTPLSAPRPVLRVRVVQLGSRHHRARSLATFFRSAPRQGQLRVTLRSTSLRHLRVGRYEIVAALGASRSRLGRPLVRRFSVVR